MSRSPYDTEPATLGIRTGLIHESNQSHKAFGPTWHEHVQGKDQRPVTHNHRRLAVNHGTCDAEDKGHYANKLALDWQSKTSRFSGRLKPVRPLLCSTHGCTTILPSPWPKSPRACLSSLLIGQRSSAPPPCGFLQRCRASRTWPVQRMLSWRLLPRVSCVCVADKGPKA